MGAFCQAWSGTQYTLRRCLCGKGGGSQERGGSLHPWGEPSNDGRAEGVPSGRFIGSAPRVEPDSHVKAEFGRPRCEPIILGDIEEAEAGRHSVEPIVEIAGRGPFKLFEVQLPEAGRQGGEVLSGFTARGSAIGVDQA